MSDKVILSKDFDKEQKKVANQLLEQLLDSSEELSEFSTVFVYGLVDRGGAMSILFEISYGESEEDKSLTIFDSY